MFWLECDKESDINVVLQETATNTKFLWDLFGLAISPGGAEDEDDLSKWKL